MPRRTNTSGPGTGRRIKPVRWDPRINPDIERDTKPVNEFTRNLRGFSNRSLGLLIRHGLEQVDDNGFIPVRFTGISHAPHKRIGYKKPTLVKTRGGMLVVSGLVNGNDLNEIGHGSSPVRQADVPDLDSHDSPKRLNVSLGREPVGYDAHELSVALMGETAVELSEIVTVNDQNVTHSFPAQDLWHRAAATSPSHTAYRSYGW